MTGVSSSRSEWSQAEASEMLFFSRRTQESIVQKWYNKPGFLNCDPLAWYSCIFKTFLDREWNLDAFFIFIFLFYVGTVVF